MAGERMHTTHPTSLSPPLAISYRNHQKSLAFFSHLAPLTFFFFFFTKKQSQGGGAWHNAPPPKYNPDNMLAIIKTISSFFVIFRFLLAMLTVQTKATITPKEKLLIVYALRVIKFFVAEVKLTLMGGGTERDASPPRRFSVGTGGDAF